MAIVNLVFIGKGRHNEYRRFDTGKVIPTDSINFLWGEAPVKIIHNKKPTIRMNHLNSKPRANALLKLRKKINSQYLIDTVSYCRIK